MIKLELDYFKPWIILHVNISCEQMVGAGLHNQGCIFFKKSRKCDRRKHQTVKLTN